MKYLNPNSIFYLKKQGLKPKFKPFAKCGWETWIRTKTNGVRVRCSTIKLFPNMFKE